MSEQDEGGCDVVDRLSDAQVENYFKGDSRSPINRTLHQHLAGCDSCRELINERLDEMALSGPSPNGVGSDA